MTILQVLYVLAIAKEGSVSKAAESLYVSQPALSLQVRRLERELGCELFLRRPQGVSLTAEGEAFCREAQSVAEAWDQLQMRAAQLGHNVPRELRVGIGPRALASGLFEAAAAFFDGHPEIEVTYRTDMSDQVIEALEERKIDIAIDRLPPDREEKDLGNVAAFELFRERQCVLLSPDDPRAEEPEIPLSDLNGSTLISAPESSLDDLVLKSYGVQAEKVQRADNLEMAMTLIRGGKGLALGAASFARRYGVAAVPTLPPAYVALQLLCLKRTAQDPLLRQFRAYLMEKENSQQ